VPQLITLLFGVEPSFNRSIITRCMVRSDTATTVNAIKDDREMTPLNSHLSNEITGVLTLRHEVRLPTAKV
jgi:hypothetical protein